MLGESEMLDLIVRWLPPGGKVLDVGCGSGRMLTALAERGIPGMGIDPYVRGIERCRRLSAEKMDELAESFDLVYTRYTLHHLDWPRRFPESAREVLRPEGVLLIVDWVKGARTGVTEAYFALHTVVRWVREAGFEVLREEVRGQTMVVAARVESGELGPEEGIDNSGDSSLRPWLHEIPSCGQTRGSDREDLEAELHK
jgi:SAM-dependent methyltransferase